MRSAIRRAAGPASELGTERMTGPIRRPPAPVGLAAAVLAALLGASGCLSKPALVSRVYTIDPPPARASGGSAGVILALKRVEMAPPYAGQSLIYRAGAHSVERDPYARFASPPAWLLTAAIRGYLANADFVRDVVADGESMPAQATVETMVSEIAGNLDAAASSSVLTVRFRVIPEPTAGKAAPEILLKTYTKSVPISRRAAQDVVEGWNRGLAEIMVEFQTDLRASLGEAGILR